MGLELPPADCDLVIHIHLATTRVAAVVAGFSYHNLVEIVQHDKEVPDIRERALCY